MSTSAVQDPFSGPDGFGQTAAWVVRDAHDPECASGVPMDHYDAMRVSIDNSREVVSRADAVDRLPVLGHSYAANHGSASSVDIAPALDRLEMQDFVDLLNEDFGPGDTSDAILATLRQQGDPRAERLFLYTEEWSTPDAAGDRPAACLAVDRDSLMRWLEVNRSEIHDEMAFRMEEPVPSI